MWAVSLAIFSSFTIVPVPSTTAYNIEVVNSDQKRSYTDSSARVSTIIFSEKHMIICTVKNRHATCSGGADFAPDFGK